ncbi:hypothetical protein TRAPUB_12605 [Trametes pubescens]|uniref:Uncharacterized protein n=1 Tax=Trametes pubescens TaxID=154538 RepID=A0A1M2VTM9_TRAPU|nr:hypothetical protein TRAPUB_12605 [Trametes pubescens]
MSRPPTEEEILGVSRTVVDIFDSVGLRCCLFGSAACYLFGVNRTPNDIDMVVFTSDCDQEALKDILVNADSDFFLIESRNPNADYRVLWCSLRPSRRGNPRKCKVDILIPGVLDLPTVPRRREKIIDDLPVMPLIPLLLLKLQGWDHHRDSPRADQRDKQYVDVDDIGELLEIAVRRGQNVWQDNLKWMPRSLIHDAQDRVYDFCRQHPNYEDDWETVGFSV